MIRAVLVIVMIAFTLAAGGMHKLEPVDSQPEIQISSTQDVIKAGVEKCCDMDKEESGIEKPRCLGDNCISTVAALAQPDVFSSVIRRHATESLGKLELNRFLRPPIA